MKKAAKRLTILTDAEIQELYALPDFTPQEQIEYFALTPGERQEVDALRTVPSKVHFIVLLGYCKAKKCFFELTQEQIQADIDYILQTYFPTVSHIATVDVADLTRLAHQSRILKLLDYQECSKDIREKLQKKAAQLATIHVKPISLFKALLNYLENQRIVLPAYSFFQSLIGKAITVERNRLESAIMAHIPEDIQHALDLLLHDEEGLHELTLIKKEPKDFSNKAMRTEVQRKMSLESLYLYVKSFLPTLGISNENINYYAELAVYYNTARLKGLKRATASLYLLCFVFNRYHKMNDNLIHAFLYYVAKFRAKAKEEAKEDVYALKIDANQHLKHAAKVLNLFTDETIPENMEFRQIKQQAFAILEKEKFPLVSQYIAKVTFDEKQYQWNHYVVLSHKFKKNLRYLFMNLAFKSHDPNNSLMQAVAFLKKTFSQNKSLHQVKAEAFPRKVIPAALRRYVYDDDTKHVHPDKYEFLIYRLLRDRLESGDVFVAESIKFKSFEEDLISKDEWKEKDTLLQRLELPYIHEPIDKILASKEQEVEKKLKTVNDHIKHGLNPNITFTRREGETTWKLPYKKSQDEGNHRLYQQLSHVGIRDVMHFANAQCGFLDAFTHILHKESIRQPDECNIMASVLAQGLNVGLFDMAAISDRSYSELLRASQNFLRPETLRDANDKVVNTISTLPIFSQYNLLNNAIHSSSDGQKFETQFQTINSRYSPKYFGLQKGITAYTLVANHIPIHAKIIGANEHESHYVFDILFNNTSDIVPSIHSTDTHGTNEVNFAILDMFGYQFAPRYKSLSTRDNMIYGFKYPNQYGDSIIKPCRKIDTKLICKEWENIQRIIASLALRATTQASIIRKLSSYHRKNRTKQALWEYDNIIKTLYILGYIDSLECRQMIQKALNRGEAYHKLRRAVAYAHFGKFRVKTEQEQYIWNECSRLIANCIIFYNASLLSGLLEEKERLRRSEEVERIKGISPVAWQHINLYGRYEFHGQQSSIDIDETIARLEQKSL